MEMDSQLPAFGDDGVEVEAIGESANDVKLVATRIPGVDARRCACLGVAVGDVLRLINIRYRRILCRRIVRLSLGGPWRDAQVQTVNQFPRLSVIDRYKPLLSDSCILSHRQY